MRGCNHNWATYNPTPGRSDLIYHPHGNPIHQVCANCGKKRVGYPQPISWGEAK